MTAPAQGATVPRTAALMTAPAQPTPRPPRRRGGVGAGCLVLCVLLASVGCERRPPASSLRSPARKATAASDLGYLRAERVGREVSSPPWIAHVNAVDLDRDGRLDILACDTRGNSVIWIRQHAPGRFEETTLAENLKVPVRVEPADMDGDGDLDLLVGSMGAVFPNNDRIGTVFVLENDGQQRFISRAVIEHTTRVTDVRAGDFNGDGRLDLALAQFGYDQGDVSWLERVGPWEFKRHVLLELSGAINVGVADFNGDGRPDIVSNLSQQWEEVHLFENQGGGVFVRRRVWGSANEDFGSSGLTVVDLNRDARPDILFTNGDGFGPAATPGPRPWHGVQWMENVGGGNFRYRRIGDLMGAYSPVGVDLDRDGAVDVVAVAGYADWQNKDREVISLMWFRNDGSMNFEPRILAKAPKDQITVAAGDFDGDGQPSLVTAGFYVYPPYENMERVLLWRKARQ